MSTTIRDRAGSALVDAAADNAVDRPLSSSSGRASDHDSGVRSDVRVANGGPFTSKPRQRVRLSAPTAGVVVGPAQRITPGS